MMVNTPGSVLRLMKWQRRRVLLFGIAATLVWVAHDAFGFDLLDVPALPISVVGAAIGIFASFRTNAAYERWWEGRKLWGRLVNTSRHWCHQAKAYVAPHDAALAERLVHRHIAYVHVLRCLLRKEDPFADADVTRWLTAEEQDTLRHSNNLTQALLDLQLAEVTALADAGAIDGLRLQSLDHSLYDLLNIQGGCERIKGTPLPKGYGFIVDTLIDYFGWVFPFAVVSELGWVSIPLNILVGMSFTMISESGRVLEDPFDTYWNALPLMELSRKIENNLRQRLGETPLEPMILPDENGILM